MTPAWPPACKATACKANVQRRSLQSKLAETPAWPPACKTTACKTNSMQSKPVHNMQVFTQVEMLYVDMEINGVPVKAFVDTGAQMSIMTQVRHV